MRNNRPFLLVEDDEVDALLVKRALRDLNITNPLSVVGNGEEALEFLRNDRNEKPTIILLDLNMPRMNGKEFLNVVKNDSLLKRVPVVVLTTSNEEKDKIDSFDLGAAGYMVKPSGYQQFVEVMRTVKMYWTQSELPE